MLAGASTPERLSRDRSAWLLLCLTVGLALLLYLASASGSRASAGGPILPLDDAYIHFQYARVLAEGHPFQYNPGQPPTSGATSLLYPIILAVGYKLGFTGLQLGWWALGIGGLSWLLSAWLVYRLGVHVGGKTDAQSAHWIALLMAIAFALSGSLGWAFVSGMETGLMILAMLATLWYATQNDRRGVIIAGIFAALIRPEGLVIAALAVLYMASREVSRRDLWQHLSLYALPVLAALIQPLLNILLTGSATASGMQAKSFLYFVPADFNVLLSNILSTVARVWSEMLTGYSSDDGLYFVFILSWLAMFMLFLSIWRVWRNRYATPPLLVLGWLLGLTAAVSILETAFWQFKRYQQPMIALLFPVAAWMLMALWQISTGRILKIFVIIVIVLLLGGSLVTSVAFIGYYADNVREVASSQIPMARYVAANLPADAIVGVHDIGVMRYLGDHTTYDVIGLTTPNAARAFRSGPGAAYETMRDSPYRPDYFAIYNDARGLSYFAATDLFKQPPLAVFPSTSPPRNVASATNSGQAVYKADWTKAVDAEFDWQYSTALNKDMRLVDFVNVANIASEDAHGYRWWQDAQIPGFATELYEQNYVDCAVHVCTVIDGGRLITGGEEMTIATTPGQDMVWETRVHPREAATLKLFVNGIPVGTRIVPHIPGQWLEIGTFISGNLITGTKTVVRVETHLSNPSTDHYMPYYHWFYQGKYTNYVDKTMPTFHAVFGESILLVARRLTYLGDYHKIMVDLEWQLDETKIAAGELPGDAKVFVHLYAPNMLDAPPIAQEDKRPGFGSLPPANWLPGIIEDRYLLIVPADTPPGSYPVAIGMYDPEHPENRLPVTGAGSDKDRRLFIGTVEIP